MQTRQINEKLADLKDTTILTISNDLPFAQARWCGAAGLDNILTLSDYQTLDFANKYGVNIVGLRLLARSVFVLNEQREVIYVEYLNEMTNHPNYSQLFDFIETL
jgi:thiol peroxidase